MALPTIIVQGIIAFIAISAILSIPKSIIQIESGKVGIVYRAGKLQETLFLYLEKFRHANHVEKFKAEHFNLQWYKPGGGFKKWHCERCGVHDSDRHLVFMTYLNDVPKGGTKFLYQDLELPAKKGLTVIWPSDWTHTHKGVISKEHEKYIITGWFNYT